MKIRILGLTCLASLAVGCQSASSKALSRWNSSNADGAQLASATTPGLPTPSQKKTEQSEAQRADSRELYSEGETSLRDYYRNPQPETLEAARKKFAAAAAADPGFAPAQHRLGIVCDLQERYDQSEGYYLTAMSLDPGNANIPADLGYSYQLQQRWMAAERYLAQALQIDPKHAKAAEHLAEVYVHEGKTLLAEQTLMRVMPRDQAQSRLASMTSSQPLFASGRQEPAATTSDSGSTAQQKLLAEFQRAGVEGAAARAQAQQRFATQNPSGPPMSQGAAGSPWGQPTNPARPDQLQGQALRDQLAQIDQAGRHDPNTAIVIGDRTIQPAGNAAVVAPGAGSQINPAVASMPADPLPVISPGRMENPAFAAGTSAGNAASPSLTPAQIYAGNRAMNPLRNRQDLSGGGFQMDALEPGTIAPQAPASNGLGPGQPSPSGLAGSVPNESWGNSASVDPRSAGPGSAASFDEARRAAALMGLGVGPGQMFSALEHQANRQATAGQVRETGPYYPDTGSPYAQPPQADMRQSSATFPTQPLASTQRTAGPEYAPAQGELIVQRPATPSMAPPPNSMGQHMPASSPVMTTPADWGGPSASPYAAPQQQPINAPPLAENAAWQQRLDGYEDARRQVSQTLDQTVHSAWANSPAQAIPSPASGVAYQQPAPPAQQMESWNRRPVAPEPYPNVQQPSPATNQGNILPAVSPASGQSSSRYAPMTTRSVTPTYRDGVVVPEQYRGTQ